MKQRLEIFPLIGLVLSLGLFAASCSAAAPSVTPNFPCGGCPYNGIRHPAAVRQIHAPQLVVTFYVS